MKKISIYILTILIGAVTVLYWLGKASFSEFRFHSNTLPWNANQDISNVTRGYDFSVAFEQVGMDNGTHIKIFARKDQQWWKISIASPTGQSLRSSYSVDWLLCTAEEGERFYETLNSGGLFSLPEEDELTERCGEIEQAFDALEYRIQLKAGMRVRTLKYTDPTLWRQNCSNIEAWTNVERIVEAFKTRWYEHGNQSIIKKFLNLVNNHESKFIDFAVLVTPAPSDSLSFNTMLSRFRTSLKIHQGESQVNLFPYTELKPRRDDLPIIEVEQGMLKDTYVVVDDRNRVLFPVIIKNQRIMSFMTSEGKDGKNYFVFWE